MDLSPRCTDRPAPRAHLNKLAQQCVAVASGEDGRQIAQAVVSERSFAFHSRIGEAFRGGRGFDDAGRIVKHRDSFDFWKWSRQALGAPGVLLGWTPFLRGKVRGTANANLRRFLDRQPG